MARYAALLDGKAGAYGITVPDLPGSTSGASTTDKALRNAIEAVRLWAEDAIADGEALPQPRPVEMLLADRAIAEAIAEGAALAIVPLLLEAGRLAKVNLSIDARFSQPSTKRPKHAALPGPPSSRPPCGRRSKAEAEPPLVRSIEGCRSHGLDHGLAAILAADTASYSRLMGADEERTHEALKIAGAQAGSLAFVPQSSIAAAASAARCAAHGGL
jgi:predicted RNase H-like HicB family nuclease